VSSTWANEYIEEGGFQFVGVEHIHSLSEAPADGVEVGGSFYESEDVWQSKSELIPEKDAIPAIMWEQNSDVPVGELMTEKQINAAKRIFGETDDN